MISSGAAAIVSTICLTFLCSCSTQPKPLAKGSLPVEPPTELPPECTAHESFRQGFPLALTLRLGDGTEALFLVDTGCTKTTLDSSFEPTLGPCLGRRRVVRLEGGIGRAKLFAAPKLYLGNTRLMTGDTVLTGKVSGPHDCPYQGILGMDCLWHYCVELDFAAGKVRFLDSHDLQRKALGTALPMAAESPVPLIDLNLSGVGRFRFMVDSGFWNVVDATLTPAQMRKALESKLLTPTSLVVGFRVFSCETMVIDQESYKDLFLGEVPIQGKEMEGFIGLRFLRRHVVTFDFPSRVLYLKRKVA